MTLVATQQYSAMYHRDIVTFTSITNGNRLVKASLVLIRMLVNCFRDDLKSHNNSDGRDKER